MSEQSPNDEFYAGLYWVRATPDAGLRVATPKECAAEIIRLRALITPTPPAQDAPHGAGAQRTGSDGTPRPQGAYGAAIAIIVLLAATPALAFDFPTCWSGADGVQHCMTPDEMTKAGMKTQPLPDGTPCFALPNGGRVCRS